MRIEGRLRTEGAGAGVPRAPGPGGQRFSVPEAATPAPTNAATASRAAHGVDVLLALQSFDVSGERRRRAVQRGRSLLDALDALKLALIEGTLPESGIARLRALIAEQRLPTGDAGLDDLLDAVELRAKVELAKWASSPRF